jgi:cell fate regulator YaaT (PSP1 superfamily)
MIKIAEVQFYPWDKIYDFYVNDLNVQVGNNVIVTTELGSEAGKVVGIREEEDDKYELLEDNEWTSDNSPDEEPSFAEATADEEDSKKKLRPITRLLNKEDEDKIKEYERKKPEMIEYCKGLIRRMGLPMKLVDVDISFDGGRIIFAFIADGRVDFRELVKEATRHFQKSVRMQQLGTRDEAKVAGDIGQCGRILCCKKFLKTLGGVTSELASNQQIAHRGSDRLSGACGRLMCCLRYENDSYVELAKKLPEIGSTMKTPQGEGVVIGWHTLKQTVDVKIGDGKNKVIVEMEIDKSKVKSP